MKKMSMSSGVNHLRIFPMNIFYHKVSKKLWYMFELIRAYFNYFIIYSPAQPFRRGYAHIHLFSTVFKSAFLASQPEQLFFIRCKITLYQEPVYIFLCEHI